jgi:hypothetical protein
MNAELDAVVPAAKYCELVLAAYTGEVVGEAVFGGIAMLLVDPQRRATLEVLRLLEAQTEAALRPLAERCGLTADQVVRSRRSGWSYALMAADDDARWAQVVDGLVQGCPDIIARFERLRALAPETDAVVADEVVAHEVALFEFAQLETAGAEAPLAPVLARLHGRHRAEARASMTSVPTAPS